MESVLTLTPLAEVVFGEFFSGLGLIVAKAKPAMTTNKPAVLPCLCLPVELFVLRWFGG